MRFLGMGILSTVMRDRGWGNMGAAEDVKRLPAEPGHRQEACCRTAAHRMQQPSLFKLLIPIATSISNSSVQRNPHYS
jgi:hypothetical protein